MKILYIHNEYKTRSGEEHASEEIATLLTEHGHEIRWFKRSSVGQSEKTGFKIKSFFLGIYNPFIVSELEEVLEEYKPDLVQIQNIYPLISVSVFSLIKRKKIPLVMRCPNYRLFCPTGLCLDTDKKVCEKCFAKGKELWCVKKNCEQSRLKSLGYALRNGYARKSGSIQKNVDMFIVQSGFQQTKFIQQGIKSDHIGIVPGIVPELKKKYTNSPVGEWVSFVGRISQEKGIYTILDTARQLSHIPFKMAGDIDTAFVMPDDIPSNVEFVGFKSADELNEFYLNSRIILAPSIWYEGFPNVITRGMMLGKPIITTNIGAMATIIDNGINGVLVSPNNTEELTKAIDKLYTDEQACISMGKSGKEKAEKEYSREVVYQLLMEVYEKAMKNNDSI